jgi:hypothetical protein
MLGRSLGEVKMRAFRNLVLCVAMLLAPVSAASAAGLYGGANVACNYGSTLQDTGDIRVLRDELYSRYHHAIDVYHQTINSTGPAFLWAKETKIACAKAIGYLKLGHFRREIDPETIWKCQCFYDRMVRYAGRR